MPNNCMGVVIEEAVCRDRIDLSLNGHGLHYSLRSFSHTRQADAIPVRPETPYQ
jgi:hypothetical protein